jgi:ABC-2 type transport system ATP-binding protein
MIAVQGLTKYYGPIAAVEDLSFEVGQGEIVGFLGPNGAGKSTTMRILTAFAPATRGEARIAGYEVHQNPLEVKRRIGYLPERVPLYEEMVVSSFLNYVAELKGVSRANRVGEVGEALERCGLSDMGNRLIANLSKGYKQRVGLAQALIGSPPVLILDEPTVGLDPAQIVEIRQMIKGLRDKHTVLISTHILPEVAMLCERVIIINQGHIVAEEKIENLSDGSGATRLEEIFMRVVSSDRAAILAKTKKEATA